MLFSRSLDPLLKNVYKIRVKRDGMQIQGIHPHYAIVKDSDLPGDYCGLQFRIRIENFFEDSRMLWILKCKFKISTAMNRGMQSLIEYRLFSKGPSISRRFFALMSPAGFRQTI